MQNSSQLQELFQNYLSGISFDQQPSELYQPVNYILTLGGKRLRPVLVLMAHNLFDNSVEKALAAALAVEIFHNFSLVHDDIMDEAPLRRGKPTVHKQYGVNSGILSGDLMLIYSYNYLLQLEDKSKIPAIVRVFNKVGIEVCEGQQFDINFESRQDVTIEEYLKMISLKTASLVAGSLEIGAIIGGAEPGDCGHLAEFGRNIGLAFQLQDDILDTFGDPSKFGKKIGGDIAHNKKTFLLLKAFEIADSSTKRELQKLLDSPSHLEAGKIEKVTSIFQRLGIKAMAEEVKSAHLKLAFQYLDMVGVSEERKLQLRMLASQLMGREI